MKKLSKQEKEEIKAEFKRAEERVMKKIKKRMEQMARSERIKAEDEAYIETQLGPEDLAG
jgi:hypothetical protein